ncbi:MAG: hypothetical protein ACE5KT_05285 [Methanosarcinales archaeon]
MNDYTKKAIEFYNKGTREYEEGLKTKDTIKVREGCEKIFHAFVELSNGILIEHGYPIPKNHVIRSENLSALGLGATYDHVKERLHDTCYYDGIIREKYLVDAIKIVNTEIKKRTL